MSRLFQSAAIGISLSVAACAIHPLPEDVSGVPTYMIARKIRCEARAAVKKNLTDWLVSLDAFPAMQKLGVEFKDGTRPLDTFRDSMFSGQVKTIIQKFENSAIAYDFSFNMTETNNIDPTLDLFKTVRRGTATGMLSGGFDRTRQNIRTFTLTDTFLKLMTEVKEDYCQIFTDGKNYIYPITGTIGIGEMIHTFVELSLFANLAGKSSGPPTMVDTIAFTTKLSVSAVPKIVLTPIGNAVQLADASLIANASRTDVHQVAIGLALPPAPKPHGAAEAAAPQAKVGTLVNARGTSAETTAAHAIEQYILRFEVGKPIVVVAPNP